MKTKKRLGSVLFVVLLFSTIVFALTCGTTWAQIPFIRIDDINDGNPVITTSSNLSPTITLAFEQATITNPLPPGTTIPPTALPISVIFAEPTSDPFGPRVSDFLTIQSIQLPTGGLAVQVFFQSDGATGFDRNVAALPAGTPSILEDGTFQNVIPLLFPDLASTFALSMRSDLASTEVPEPVTILLIGLGLVGPREIQEEGRKVEQKGVDNRKAG